MNMEIEIGYKQTKVGVIPSDWHVVQMDAIGELKMGKGLLKSDISLFGDIPAIPYTSLYTDFSEVIDPEKITWFTSKKNAPYIVNYPCVLFASSSNVLANTGKACALTRGLPVAVGREVISFSTDQNVAFISYLLGTSFYRKKTLDLARGITIRHVYPTTFIGYEIALPPLTEQSAIAEALSDVDFLIANLNALIAKKIDLKTATMQQLLTGKTRLPGFSEEWEVKRVIDFTDCAAGGTPNTLVDDYWGGSIRWMNSGELNLKRVYEVEGRITEAGLNGSSTRRVTENCVLIGLAGQGKTRGTVAINYVELCTNQSIAAIFPNDFFSSEYLYQNLNSRYEELRELSSGGGRGGLNLSLIRSLKIPFPSLEEQIAIAKVLSDIDTELTALEYQCDKARQFKQGMMQELLTGRIRLV